jgi:hypothetical protein
MFPLRFGINKHYVGINKQVAKHLPGARLAGHPVMMMMPFILQACKLACLQKQQIAESTVNLRLHKDVEDRVL